MSPFVSEHRPAFERAIEHLKGELATIRGNRAHPSLVEDVPIEAYGASMTVRELASITIPDPRTIVVQPWDKTVLKDLERGLTAVNLNLGIANDGTVVRLSLPPLTAESRQSLLKVVGQKLEAARVQLRQLRDRVKEGIITAERDKRISEDDRYTAQEDLDELTKEFTDQVNALGKRKEEEIVTI